MKTKLLFVILVLAGSSFQHLFGSDSIAAGNVSGHWLHANSPYKIYGNITVPFDSTLQIDSGVVVVFQGHYQMEIQGCILATGTSSSPVTFTAATTWWGIRFIGIPPTQDSSLLIHCRLEKGFANGTYTYANGGALYIYYTSKLRISYCTIAGNTAHNYGGAIYLDHCAPVISENSITGNNAESYYGGGIYCNFAAPRITGNTLSNNGGSIECQNSSPFIFGNIISYNSMGGIGCKSSSPSIVNNTIAYNSRGVHCNLSAPYITGNDFHHNSANYGAGIRCEFTSNPHITNNTFAYNTASVYGGAMQCDQSSSPVIKNTIFWGNTASSGGDQVSLDVSSHPAFYNCDMQGGSAMIYYFEAPNTFTGTYVDNINADPGFTDPTYSDYSLKPGSPCIDKGTLDTTGLKLPAADKRGGQRVCNGRVDIGADEECTVTGIRECSAGGSGVFIYPNPASDQVTVELAETQLSCRVTIFNATGREILKRELTGQKNVLNISGLPAGVYFLQLTSESETRVSRLFKY